MTEEFVYRIKTEVWRKSQAFIAIEDGLSAQGRQNPVFAPPRLVFGRRFNCDCCFVSDHVVSLKTVTGQ